MTVKLWVARDSHFPMYFTLTQDQDPEGYITSWETPVEVDEQWFQQYQLVQRQYFDLQHELAVKAGYEDG